MKLHLELGAHRPVPFQELKFPNGARVFGTIGQSLGIHQLADSLRTQWPHWLVPSRFDANKWSNTDIFLDPALNQATCFLQFMFLLSEISVRKPGALRIERCLISTHRGEDLWLVVHEIANAFPHRGGHDAIPSSLAVSLRIFPMIHFARWKWWMELVSSQRSIFDPIWLWV